MFPLATGNWIGGKTGVSQLLYRNDHISTLSHLRRVISPLSRSQPHFEARDLHPTQWGRLCPSETPEGPNCGLVKNFAEMVELSTGIDDITPIKNKLYTLGVEKFQILQPEIIDITYNEKEKKEFENDIEKNNKFMNSIYNDDNTNTHDIDDYLDNLDYDNEYGGY